MDHNWNWDSESKVKRGSIELEFFDWFADVKMIVEAVSSEISAPRIAGKQIHLANGATPED